MLKKLKISGKETLVTAKSECSQQFMTHHLIQKESHTLIDL